MGKSIVKQDKLFEMLVCHNENKRYAHLLNTVCVVYGIFVLFFRLSACTEDWVEIYVLFRDGVERFIGRYCGTTSPGPMETPSRATGIRILFRTDAENVSSGFKGRYVFEVAKSVTGKSKFLTKFILELSKLS